MRKSGKKKKIDKKECPTEKKLIHTNKERILKEFSTS